MKTRMVGLIVFLTGALAAGVAACGDDTGGQPDGSTDGTLPDTGGNGDSAPPRDATISDGPQSNDGSGGDGSNPNYDGGIVFNDSGCGWNTCATDGGPVSCLDLGVQCKQPSDCCSGNCFNGSCQPPACANDNTACTANGQCCSGTCGAGGTCTPLSNTCKTLGNSCKSSAECCSTFCGPNGTCDQPSYCTQNGDLCAKPADCCGGICTIAAGKTFGTCGQPPPSGAQCSAVDGVVCFDTDAGLTDAGLPTCGGACCSRDCAPWGPTGVFICQPASGCHPVGDICYKDTDCCGATGYKGDAGLTTCNQPGPGQPGVCSNPTGCKPNGDICRLKTNQCNATDECCSGTVQKYDTCHQDNLGVPRCSYAGDAGCTPSNGTCATSADCCNLNPCVPNGVGGFTCYPAACVPTTGPCTNNADCCSGNQCYYPPGQTAGSCQPLTPQPDGGTSSDGGTPGDSGTPSDAGTDAPPPPPPCALYGQLCSQASDCCNGIPCTNGRCEYPVN